MTDSWLETHEDTMADSISRFERGQLSASDCIQKFGITCDSPLDTWTMRPLKQQAYAKYIGDRLDYIFYRRSPAIYCQQSKVVMEEYIPGTQWSYSDHFGVQSIFTIGGNNLAIGNFAPAASQISRPDFTKLLPQTLHAAIELLQANQVQAKTTANGHLALFGFSVVTVFALFVAQIVLPITYLKNVLRAVLLSNVICGFFLILFSVIAIVSLVVGFVFGRMEQRSIRQYLIDLHVCLENLQMQARRESLLSTATATLIEQCLTNNDGNSFSTSLSATTNSVEGGGRGGGFHVKQQADYLKN